MRPKRIDVMISGAAAPTFVGFAQPGAPRGTSPAADLQQLIRTCYNTEPAIEHTIPLSGRMAIMLSMSALLWAAIVVAVRCAIG